MTEKLYYKDAYIKEFEAECVKSYEKDGRYVSVLNRTAFFPEGGGQAGDRGEINGIKICDTVEENGQILHISEQKIPTGKIWGKIDWELRFSRMQNHTAEHIVSGLVNKKFGFDNVGFHMGKNYVTADYNGELSESDIKFLEYEANGRIWRDVKVQTYFPELPFNKNYRSKKEISENLRIAEIEDTDICACCAPHVSSAGQIGIIKITGAEKHKKGVRLTVKSGSWALDEFNSLQENAMRISKMLSVPRENIADAVEKTSEKLKECELARRNILLNCIKEMAEKCANPYMFTENAEFLKDVANILKQKFGKAYAFSGSNGNYRFMALDENEERLDNCLKKIGAKGGGRNGMRQGTVKNTKDEIISALSANLILTRQ